MIISPFSSLTWYVLQWGTFYIPHVVFSLFYIGLFLRILQEFEVGTVKRIPIVLFSCLAFLSGLSTIRYILNFQFPLAMVMVIAKVFEKQSNKVAFFLKIYYDR